jgi:hypothetical protein
VPACGGALLPRIAGLDIAVKSWVNVRISRWQRFDFACIFPRLA